MTRECQCPIPDEHGKNRPGYCWICGGTIRSEFLSSDQTFADFFSQISKLPGVTGNFVEHCRVREFAGREEFGLAYLDGTKRNNPFEAQEEGADGGNYAFFEYLCDVRAGEQQVDHDLLDAAHHFALAHAAMERRRARKNG